MRLEVLPWRAVNQPEKICYTYLLDGETKEIDLNYGELHISARRIASKLIRSGSSGQSVLLFFSPGLDLIKAFFGCLYAGAIAIPNPLPYFRTCFRQTVDSIRSITGQ